MGEAAHVGPFARLRPGADIRAGAHIGNFVEVKNSVIREGTRANQLSYLGDASVGSGANIGPGTITCNYDGVNKNKTTIGNRVFIGSDTALVAPVRVGNGAYVAVRINHYGKCSGRCVVRCARAAGQQAGLGPQTAPRNEPRKEHDSPQSDSQAAREP